MGIVSSGIIKPYWPFTVNRDRPSTNSLLMWLPVRGNESNALVDELYSNDVTLPFVNSSGLVSTAWGIGLDNFNGNDMGVRNTTPAHLKGLTELSIEYIGAHMTTTAPSAAGSLIEITPDNAASSPFITYGIGFNSAANLRGEFTNGSGGFSECNSPININSIDNPFKIFHVVFCLKDGTQLLYYNGAEVASTSGTFTGGTAGATSQLCIGCYATNVSRNPQVATLHSAIYNKFLNTTEVLGLYNAINIFNSFNKPMFLNNLRRRYLDIVTAPPGDGISSIVSGSFVNSSIFTS